MIKMLIVALVLLAGGVVAVRQLEQRTVPSAAMATAQVACAGLVGVLRPQPRAEQGPPRPFRGRGARRRAPDRVPGRHRRVHDRAARKRCAQGRDLSPRGRLHRQGQHRQWRDQGGLGGPAHGRGRRHRGAQRARAGPARRRRSASTCSACRSSRACAGRTSAASSCSSSSYSFAEIGLPEYFFPIYGASFL